MLAAAISILGGQQRGGRGGVMTPGTAWITGDWAAIFTSIFKAKIPETTIFVDDRPKSTEIIIFNCEGKVHRCFLRRRHLLLKNHQILCISMYINVKIEELRTGIKIFYILWSTRGL